MKSLKYVVIDNCIMVLTFYILPKKVLRYLLANKSNKNLVIEQTCLSVLPHQGSDEPILLQVSVQECGVFVREEQNPSVFQSGHSRRQHRASERLHGGWTCHSPRRGGLFSTGTESLWVTVTWKKNYF